MAGGDSWLQGMSDNVFIATRGWPVPQREGVWVWGPFVCQWALPLASEFMNLCENAEVQAGPLPLPPRQGSVSWVVQQPGLIGRRMMWSLTTRWRSAESRKRAGLITKPALVTRNQRGFLWRTLRSRAGLAVEVVSSHCAPGTMLCSETGSWAGKAAAGPLPFNCYTL